MITNIDIDEDLVAQAMKVSGARSKREVVDRALREMVARANRPRLRDIFGTATEDSFWPGYDPKTEPGEPPGKYRVEQGIAGYKVAPPVAEVRPASPPRRKK
jgi:Bacterial antitoxin of type II TA system, VapB